MPMVVRKAEKETRDYPLQDGRPSPLQPPSAPSPPEYRSPPPEYPLPPPEYPPPPPPDYSPPLPEYSPPPPGCSPSNSRHTPSQHMHLPQCTPPPSYSEELPSHGIQQPSTTVVMVEPEPPVLATRILPVKDYHLGTSLILSFLCLFCASWWALCCTIPAIFVALSATKAAERGEYARATHRGQVALALDVAAVVSYVLVWIVVIGLVAGLQGPYGCYFNGYISYCH